jgi:hypothetical protein
MTWSKPSSAARSIPVISAAPFPELPGRYTGSYHHGRANAFLPMLQWLINRLLRKLAPLQ